MCNGRVTAVDKDRIVITQHEVDEARWGFGK